MYFNNSNRQYNKDSMPSIPHDDQSLTAFINWMLESPLDRFVPPKTMPKDFIDITINPPLSHFNEKLNLYKPKEFEKLVAEFLEHLGGKLIPHEPGPDGGIDILWKTKDAEYIIQCKRHSKPIRIQAVREIYGVLEQTGVNGALIVTNNSFTSVAINFVNSFHTRIGLINGRDLYELMNWIAPKMVEDILKS